MDQRQALRSWIDYVVEPGRRPETGFPPLALLERLRGSFEATVSWNWARSDGVVGWRVLGPPAGWPPPGAVDYWLAHQQEHPLLRWYARTGSLAPMTMGRVPAAVAGRRDIEAAQERLGSREMTQELSIPLCMSATAHGAFVISRGGRDFSDADLDLATRIQPLLMVLEAQARRLHSREARIADRFGLTIREMEVLCCLEAGLTMGGTARRLACSPRTVEKHLEHLYRKLGVRNRLDALRAVDALPAGGTSNGEARPTAPGPTQLVFQGRVRSSAAPADSA